MGRVPDRLGIGARPLDALAIAVEVRKWHRREGGFDAADGRLAGVKLPRLRKCRTAALDQCTKSLRSSPLRGARGERPHRQPGDDSRP
jgi:hypothetical protein